MKIKSKKPMILSLALVLVCSLFNGMASANGAKVTFNPITRNLDFTYGNVAMAYGSGSVLTGIRHKTLTNIWNGSAYSAIDVKKGHSTLSQTWGNGATRAELETSVSAKYDGCLRQACNWAPSRTS